MASIFLVRHGKTDFIGKILCGNTPGIHLNEEGHDQAQKSADYLSNFPIKAIYSSPMERACETAAPLAKLLNLEVITQEFLREINFGDFQGKGSEYLLAHPIWQKFVEKPSETKFPGGESILEARERINGGLCALANQYGDNDNVVCFAHCEILLLAVCVCLSLNPDFMHQLTIDPASVSKIEITSDRKKLRLLNYQP